MRRVPLLLILLTLTLGGGSLVAGTLEEDFPLEGTVRVGPFRVRPFILIKDTGFDDNLFLEDQDRTSDFTSTVEPGFRLLTLFEDRAALVVEERLDYVWFAQQSALNHFNNAFKAQANVYLKRITFLTDLDLNSIEERPSTDPESSNSDIDIRIRRSEHRGGVGLKYERERSSLQLRVGADDFRYSSNEPEGESIEDSLNRVERLATLTAKKKILPKTTFLAEWELRQIAFDEAAGQLKDSDSSRLSGGFEFDPTAFIRGQIKVGMEHLRPDLPAQTGFRDWVGEGRIQYRVTGGTDLEFRGRRRISFTTAPGNVYYIDTSYGSTLVQRVADRVAAEVGVDRQKLDYPEETSVTDRETGVTEIGFRVDEIRSYFVGGSYRFSDQTRLGLRVGIWERGSSLQFRDRRRHTAQVTYTYNF